MTRSPDDPAGEFRKAVADVEPLAARPRRPGRPPPTQPMGLQRRRDALDSPTLPLAPFADEHGLETGEELVFLRDGLGTRTLRRLRRGHWVVQAELDLHGLNRDEAVAQVAAFLNQSTARGQRCVRIVHGKGIGSPNREPVLKSVLRRWLPTRAEVLACCQAPMAQGGSGAALVLLRPARG